MSHGEVYEAIGFLEHFTEVKYEDAFEYFSRIFSPKIYVFFSQKMKTKAIVHFNL